MGDSFFNDEDFGEEENGPDADSQSASGSGGGDEREAERAIKSVVDAVRFSGHLSSHTWTICVSATVYFKLGIPAKYRRWIF